jgi:hypothetical protein
MKTVNCNDPLDNLMRMYNFPLLDAGGGAGFFSHAAEYATASALRVAKLSAAWLSRMALEIMHQWSFRLNADDSVSIQVARRTLFCPALPCPSLALSRARALSLSLSLALSRSLSLSLARSLALALALSLSRARSLALSLPGLPCLRRTLRPPSSQWGPERLMIYCQTVSVSVAHATHCALTVPRVGRSFEHFPDGF